MTTDHSTSPPWIYSDRAQTRFSDFASATTNQHVHIRQQKVAVSNPIDHLRKRNLQLVANMDLPYGELFVFFIFFL